MNMDLVEQIVALIGEFPVSEITVEQEGRRVCARRPLTAPPVSSVMADVSEPEVLSLGGPAAPAGAERASFPEEARLLLSPLVGIFHHAEPPLPYAADVRPGQIIGYIESMKLMNDVVAEESGHVTDVLVEDGAPVEYGQALFRLTPPHA